MQVGPQRRSCADGRGVRDTGASTRKEGELRENGPQGRNSEDEVNKVAGEDRFPTRRGLGFM